MRKPSKVSDSTVANEMNHLFDLVDKEDDHKFEEMSINSDFMHLVFELMVEKEIKSKKELALKLGVSKAYIYKLFSSDKYFNVKLLRKLQEIFDTRFVFTTLEKSKVMSVKLNPIRVRSEVRRGQLKIYLEDTIHLMIPMNKIIGMQSYVTGKDNHRIDFYTDSTTIEASYVREDLWKLVLAEIDKLNFVA